MAHCFSSVVISVNDGSLLVTSDMVMVPGGTLKNEYCVHNVWIYRGAYAAPLAWPVVYGMRRFLPGSAGWMLFARSALEY